MEVSLKIDPLVLTRAALGGVLMGLANLVPGISGGTMLLAAGVYPRFVTAVAEVSTLKLRAASIVLLGTIAVAAAAGILLLAGPVKNLVIHQRWVMYSLFIGLTLGGLPMVWRMAQPIDARVYAGAVGGFAAMVALGLSQASGAASGEGETNQVLLGVAGLMGASAMILPGVSGGYLLLVLGQYVPILGGIEAFTDALSGGELATAMETASSVLLPVAVGVLIGVVTVSNIIKWLLAHLEKQTLGVLIGLLLGAVAGLWPFQASVPPEIGTLVKGVVVTAESLPSMDPEDWPTALVWPGAAQALGALGLVLLGAMATTAIAQLGRED